MSLEIGSVDRFTHEPEGVVGAAEATDWAWDQTPLDPDLLLVLLAVARHVRLTSLDALPALLGLPQRVVERAVVSLIDTQRLCPSKGGGVHVTLDCNCTS